jgi:hypothetical protein
MGGSVYLHYKALTVLIPQRELDAMGPNVRATSRAHRKQIIRCCKRAIEAVIDAVQAGTASEQVVADMVSDIALLHLYGDPSVICRTADQAAH